MSAPSLPPVRILATCPSVRDGETPLDPAAVQQELAMWLTSHDPAYCLPPGVQAILFTSDGRLIGRIGGES